MGAVVVMFETQAVHAQDVGVTGQLDGQGVSWLEWNELYQSGSIVDAGWMLSYGLIAVAASLSVDTCAVQVEEAPAEEAG